MGLTTIVIIIAGSLIFLGLAILTYFLTRKTVSYGLKHYENMRNKITLKKRDNYTKDKEEEKEITEVIGEDNDSKDFGYFSIANIIGAFITIMIGVSLIPIISKQVNEASFSSNMTTFSRTTLDAIPFFFGLGILLVALATTFQALKSAGVV